MASWCAHFSAAYAPGPAGPPGRDGRDGLPGICLKDIESTSNSKYQVNTLRLLLSSSNRKCRKSYIPSESINVTLEIFSIRVD